MASEQPIENKATEPKTFEDKVIDKKDSQNNSISTLTFG
jgi:hypothetical protein